MAGLRTFVAALMLALAVAPPAAAAPPAVLAADWDWDWDAFKKYWRRQLGKTAGIAGVVTCVVGVGALIIMSARKKT
jgi:hypothetical protein